MTQVVIILEYDTAVPDDICENLADVEIQYEGVRQVTVISGRNTAIRNREENMMTLRSVENPDA